MLAAVIALVIALRYLDIVFVVATSLLVLALFLLFRDPYRDIPAAPLGVVSPVDGKVLSVDRVDHGVPQGEAHRVRIEIDSFGAYTARAPVEGKIHDLHSIKANTIINYENNALWIQTDEGDDVILQFTGFRFGLAPIAFAKYGERVGQGQRCGYLRLTRCAEVHLPIAGQVLAEAGQIVVAGSDLIGKVPHP